MTGFIDTNIFIYASTAHPEFGPIARSILDRVHKGEKAVTSTMVLSEVAWVLEAKGVQSQIKPTLERISSINNLEVVGFSLDDMFVASTYLTKYGLDFNDAVNLSIMTRSNLSLCYTNDKKHLGKVDLIETRFE